MKELSTAEYWNNRYVNRRNGWDNGRAHPYLAHAMSYMQNLNEKSVLVIGAGPGHDAFYFSHYAKSVTALDFSTEAKTHFEKYYPETKIQYVVGDFFAWTKDQGQFDIVFEHTLLCAIDPSRYADYFSAVNECVKPNSFFAGIVWNKSPVDQGPPFSVPNATVLNFLKPHFDIHVESPVDETIPGREGTETFFYAKKVR
jgi:SAM-dependent methyltransferase